AQPGGGTGHASNGDAHAGADKSTGSPGKNSPTTTTRSKSHPHAAKPTAAVSTDASPKSAKPTATKPKPQSEPVAAEHAAAAVAATESSPAPAAAPVAGPASAAIEKTTRHTTTSQSSTGTAAAAPSGAASTSGALSVLAAVSQLASTPINSGNPNSAAIAAAQTNTTWLAGKTATPGASVTLALQEITQAQTAVGNNVVPQVLLSVARWALSTWQSTNAGTLAYYAKNSTGLLGFVAQVSLNVNESLPGIARTALLAAQALTVTSSSTSTLIGQAAQDGRVYASVPLSMYQDTEPIVQISVNGGPMVKVLVDTGSSGLVLNSASVGQGGLGAAVGSGTSGYSGGLTYSYDVYNTTVNFGNGIATGLTTVDVVTPATQAAYEKYIAADGVVGVLGIGANSVGPGPSLVTAALPGELRDGIFINEAAGVLQFGPNPRPVRVAVSGSPNVSGVVKVPVLQVSSPINLLIDSGGVYGTIPSTVWTAVGETQVPGGITISVYAADGTTLLYSYKTTNSNAPVVTTDAAESEQMNTGYTPFANNPMYIAYTTTNGETDFDL
ncbi:MAG: PecA family PE domain-processing aspartic protease, partial [Mycobacterium sp.]